MTNRENTSEGAINDILVRSIVRAHAWLQQLTDGSHEFVEDLADANSIHPKVVRQVLRLAYLPQRFTSALLEGKQPTAVTLARIPKLLPLSWIKQQLTLGSLLPPALLPAPGGQVGQRTLAPARDES